MPSGMTPFPWVALILPQRFVLPDLQSLHSPHSGLLVETVSHWTGVGDVEKIRLGNVLYVLKSDDIIAGLDVGHIRSNALNDTGAFVSKHDRKSTLGVLAA